MSARGQVRLCRNQGGEGGVWDLKAGNELIDDLTAILSSGPRCGDVGGIDLRRVRRDVRGIEDEEVNQPVAERRE